MNSIVVIHCGAIGDLVQALPALAAVRRTWPGAMITLVGHRKRAALALLAGAVDAIADFDGAGLWRVAHDPAAALPPIIAGADLVLDFLGTAADALGRRKSDRPRSTALAPLPQAIALAPLPPPGWDRPASDWIGGQIAEHLSVAVAGEPEIPVPPGALAHARRLLAARGVSGRFLLIHPGSGSPRKNWPMDRFAEIARRLLDVSTYQVVWMIGPAEIERAALQPRNSQRGTSNTGSGTSAGDRREVVLHDLTLERAAAVLALADAYLGNDSGITQVAAAVRRPDPAGHSMGTPHRSPAGRATPTVALFGPSDPRVWAPRGPHVQVICSHGGTIDAISVDDVWAAVEASVERS